MTLNGSASTPAHAACSGTAVHYDTQHLDMGTVGRSPALEDALHRLARVPCPAPSGEGRVATAMRYLGGLKVRAK